MNKNCEMTKGEKYTLALAAIDGPCLYAVVFERRLPFPPSSRFDDLDPKYVRTSLVVIPEHRNNEQLCAFFAKPQQPALSKVRCAVHTRRIRNDLTQPVALCVRHSHELRFRGLKTAFSQRHMHMRVRAIISINEAWRLVNAFLAAGNHLTHEDATRDTNIGVLTLQRDVVIQGL